LNAWFPGLAGSGILHADTKTPARTEDAEMGALRVVVGLVVLLAADTLSAQKPVKDNPQASGTSSTAVRWEDWEIWWRYNAAPFLKLKENLFRVIDLYSGPFPPPKPPDTGRPTRSLVRERVIPRIQSMLEADDAAIRESACVALGQTGGAAEVPALTRMIRDPEREVREAAVVGLGLLQCQESIPPLLDVLDADRKGVVLCGGGKPTWDLRAMAATSLGLCGDAETGQVKDALKRWTGHRAGPSLRNSATIALGLLKGDRDYCADLVSFLKDLASQSEGVDVARAHAVVALSRIISRNGLRTDSETTAWVAKLVPSDSSKHVRRSAVIALGILLRGNHTDQNALNVLRRAFLEDQRDTMLRGFAAIALGRIGGKTAYDMLLDRVQREETNDVYPAIGLAIRCAILRDRKDDEKAALRRTRGLDALRAAFKRCKDPRIKGGIAIALGIARDYEAGSNLRDAFRKSEDVALRGYLAVSMGMVQYPIAVEDLKAALRESSDLPLLQMHVATGLGIMGCRDSPFLLLKMLRERRSDRQLCSILSALGQIGERYTLQPVIELMTDESASASVRACATRSLGRVCDDDDIPVLSQIFTNFNYAAAFTAPLRRLADIMWE